MFSDGEDLGMDDYEEMFDGQMSFVQFFLMRQQRMINQGKKRKRTSIRPQILSSRQAISSYTANRDAGSDSTIGCLSPIPIDLMFIILQFVSVKDLFKNVAHVSKGLCFLSTHISSLNFHVSTVQHHHIMSTLLQVS